MTLQESGENYLETILMLEQENGFVRSIDIANRMNYTKASISRAMGILRDNGYITMIKNRIQLTEVGRDKANAVLERHLTITKYLHDILGISSENAALDACRIEHVICEETFEKIKEAVSNKQQTK